MTKAFCGLGDWLLQAVIGLYIAPILTRCVVLLVGMGEMKGE